MNRIFIWSALLLGNYYATTFAIWFGHWFSHFKWSPTYGFHVGGHHSFYPTSERSLSQMFLYGSGRTSSIFALLPPLIVQTAIVCFLAVSWLRWMLVLEIVVITAAANWLHTQFHTGRCVMNRFTWFQRSRQLHFAHHDSDVNFMVGDHSWDRILRTYEPCPAVTRKGKQ